MLNKKVILILFTFCCLLFAVLFYAREPLTVRLSDEQELFIPELPQRLVDVKSILLESSEGSVELREVGEQWQVASKSNHPADISQIRQLLYGVAELEILEVKTSNELLLGEIGLAKDDEDSIRVIFNDQDGGAVADILFGKSQTSLSGEGKNWFIRQFKSPQSWLVSGDVNLYKSDYQWLDKAILSLNQSEIKQIELHSEENQTVKIVKLQQESDFELADLDEGETAESYKIQQIVESVSNLLFDDVRLRDNAVITTDAKAINLQTKDGLMILILITDVEQGWIVLQAIASSADESVNEKAEKYNKRWADWEYQIPKPKIEQLLRKQQDLIKSKETS